LTRELNKEHPIAPLIRPFGCGSDQAQAPLPSVTPNGKREGTAATLHQLPLAAAHSERNDVIPDLAFNQLAPARADKKIWLWSPSIIVVNRCSRIDSNLSLDAQRKAGDPACMTTHCYQLYSHRSTRRKTRRATIPCRSSQR